MDNWLIFILGLVLGIPLSIVANFATPWVKSYLEKRSLTTRERKLLIILDDYRYIKALREDPVRVNNWMFRKIAGAIWLLALIVAVVGVVILLAIQAPFSKSSLYLVIIGILFLPANMSYSIARTLQVLNKVRHIEEYKEKTLAKIKKLGGNPEDLDKEETAVG